MPSTPKPGWEAGKTTVEQGELPLLVVCEVEEVLLHPGELHPAQGVLPGDVTASHVHLHARRTVFQGGGGVVETRGTATEDDHPSARQRVEVDVVLGVGAQMLRQFIHQRGKEDPAAAFQPEGEDDPACPVLHLFAVTDGGDVEVARGVRRGDTCHRGVEVHVGAGDVTVPGEVLVPVLPGNQVGGLPRGPAVLRLEPALRVQ